MKVGFSKICITPPIGTMMMGFSRRDVEHTCERVHDDIHVRALYLSGKDEQALIMGFDLCFLGREECDRYKGAIGRTLGLSARQILLNTSHSHAGPAVGAWAYAEYAPYDRIYRRILAEAILEAATQACNNARPATIHFGQTQSSVPMNRRKRMPDGAIKNRPNPDGAVDDVVPVCLFKDEAGMPISLVFSLAAHPSIMRDPIISAEYPGVAMDRIDAALRVGQAGGSLFLQGCGGDAKTSMAGRNRTTWAANDWTIMTDVGERLADEVLGCVRGGLAHAEPALAAGLTETRWPLATAPSRAELQSLMRKFASTGSAPPLEYLWAQRQLETLQRTGSLPTSAGILVQGIQLAHNVRVIALEGEPVADHGKLIQDAFRQGVTFVLGYTNGEGLYLPSSRMIDEGGYEVDSYFEYGYPSQLAGGMEQIILSAVRHLPGGQCPTDNVTA